MNVTHIVAWGLPGVRGTKIVGKRGTRSFYPWRAVWSHWVLFFPFWLDVTLGGLFFVQSWVGFGDRLPFLHMERRIIFARARDTQPRTRYPNLNANGTAERNRRVLSDSAC